MALRRRLQRVCVPSFLVMAACLAALPVTSGQNNDIQTPSLLFENLYYVAFPGSRIETFFQCLCDNTKKVCRYDYTLVNIPSYEVDAKLDTEDVSDGEMTGTTFLCHPGRFTPSDSLACVRLTDDFSWCEDQAFCQPVYVSTSSYGTCDVSCVSMAWITTSVRAVNFTGNPQVLAGFCPTNTVTSQAPATATTSTTTTSITTTAVVSSSVELNNSDGVKDVEILTILILIIVIIILILIVVFLVYRSRQKKVKPSMTNSEKHNAKESERNSTHNTTNEPEEEDMVPSTSKTVHRGSSSPPTTLGVSKHDSSDGGESFIQGQRPPNRLPPLEKSPQEANIENKNGGKKKKKQPKKGIRGNSYERDLGDGETWADRTEQNFLTENLPEPSPLPVRDMDSNSSAPSQGHNGNLKAEEKTEDGLAKVSE
ncbi:hypothetical protein ElyMa_003674700 [Elysia marginata]|uniref:Sushi domain-containing protein n=1 Tax=Elysia marginata TaxID=1093978 RepID=A0AAV4EZC4_9GAST|nr:hypothetical protein ElyMa_003674700 [Elysia marginata]